MNKIRRWWRSCDPRLVMFVALGIAILAAVGIFCEVRPTQGAGREETAQISTQETEAFSVEETESQPLQRTIRSEPQVLNVKRENAALKIVKPSPAPVPINAVPVFEHAEVLREVCAESGVPYEVALALIYTESRFDPYAVNQWSGCYGYCQLHPRYFPSGLSPEDNIRHGIGWLGELYAKHGDIRTALTVYAVGHDNGTRWYADIVCARAREWGWR